MSGRVYRVFGLVGLVIALLVASCTPQPTPMPTEEPTPVEEPTEEPVVTEAPQETPTMEPEPEPEERPLEGQTVSVLAVWGEGNELDSFRAMVAPWEEMTGATMEFEGTRDINAVLTTRVEGGNPPDIAGLPGPGQMAIYAEQGHLVDLGTFMDVDALRETYAANWLDMASVDGNLYGIFLKAAVKSLVWYHPPAFDAAGYTLPENWEELLALSDQIVADGTTPWCIGLEGGAASGWPGTDWIEDIMLRTAGPDVYDQWWRHEIPWTDPTVRTAWETWGEIVGNPDYLYGGSTGALATNFGESVYPLLEDPVGCYLHRQATFIEGFITEQFPDAQAEQDFTFFDFPPIDPAQGSPLLVAGDLLGMFNDTPAARSLMEWLTSAEAQQIWAERGGFIATNRNVSTDVYPNPLIAQAAQSLVESDVVRFDASDLMPAAVNQAFWSGVLNFVENPDNLDEILESIEQVAQESY